MEIIMKSHNSTYHGVTHISGRTKTTTTTTTTTAAAKFRICQEIKVERLGQKRRHLWCVMYGGSCTTNIDTYIIWLSTFDGILVTPGDESGEYHQMMIMVPTANFHIYIYIWESAVQWIYDNTSSIGSNPNMRNETCLLRKSSIFGKWSDQNNDSNNKYS